MKYKKLFSPLNVRGCVFPNRIQLTAAVTRLAHEKGHVTKAITDRYKRIAQGGLGSMVVEAAVVLTSSSSYNLRISEDQFVPELKGMVDEIRLVNPDLKIGLQIMHFLKVARSGWRQKVEDLTLEDIKLIPELFAAGARRTRQAGFDFVEVHMAHFTTLSSFLSLGNKREDEYGGDIMGRLKLPTEVLTAVRESVGNDYPVGVRINGEEFTKEGNTIIHSKRIAQHFSTLDVDIISVSAGERFEDAAPPAEGSPPSPGTGYSGTRMSPRWWSPDATQVHLAEGIRTFLRESDINIPVTTAGKIRTPDTAEKILEAGKADVIGMARTLFADPDWPVKAKEGRDDDIVVCAACGYCSESDERYEKVTCINWPKDSENPPVPWRLPPPCSDACPGDINIRGYIDSINQGKIKDALNIIKSKCPLPGVVSRVCPEFCKKKCNRKEFDEAVAINSLKRFVVDKVGLDKEKIIPVPRTKKERIAIVGSGPAGLSAGYFLVRMGYGVTIFEALPIAGGMMSVGIQKKRLPKDLVRIEIENIQKEGVEIRVNSPVGEKGIPLEELQKQGFDAIFLALGTKRKRELALPDGKLVKDIYGNIPDLSLLNQSGLEYNEKQVIKTSNTGFETSINGVFAGGDMINGPTSVINAIASGRKAAGSIDKFFSGESVEKEVPEAAVISFDTINTQMFKTRKQQPVPEDGNYDDQDAFIEAERCFKCGLFPKIK
jgi:2,4-dienoyl-CoA reductase-like NADH-dependent reductase (Old Yellow Enzyme family)